MPGFTSFVGQAFPPKPTFNEKEIPDLRGKVCIVTGANSGLGKEIAQLLYSRNATVYVAARSRDKSQAAIENIKSAFPTSAGQLIFLRLDLSDLTTIKASVEEFLSKERKLDVLFNNAGIGYPPQGSRSAQGYELQLGVNCIGPFLFTKLLTPTLVATAKVSAPNSVRVIWVSSSAAEAITPKGFMDNLDYHVDKSSYDKYCISKLGNYFHGVEYANRYKADGVVSVPLNPGNLDSDFWRNQGATVTCILRHTLLHPPLYGAYTNLFAAFSPEVTLEKSGVFVAPWGRFWKISDDLISASKTKSLGGTGTADQFWKWSEVQVKPYA